MNVFSRVLLLLAAMAWMAPSGLGQGSGGPREPLPQQSVPPAKTVPADSVSTGAAPDEPVAEDMRPLPEISGLMREVEAHEKTSEAIRKDYLYHAFDRLQEVDQHGGVKKTSTREFDVFWVEGVEVRKLTRKDGVELSAEEQKKESERLDKQVAKEKERKARAKARGTPTDPHGNEEITVSRLLELGSFTNARRVKLNGRDTIAVDYVGDAKAKTRNRAEDVIRDMAGTVWVDEKDAALARVEGHFLNTFKIGAGLVVNIRKGTNFSMEQRKINDEVWLPERVEGHGAARAFLLFHFNGNFLETDSNYRKFKATSTILPGMRTVDPSGSSR